MARPLPFAWPWALLFWSVYVWAFIPEYRVIRRTRTGGPSPAEDRGSLRVLIAGFLVAILAAFVFPFAMPRAALPGDPRVWFFTGLLTLISGSLLRRHCFRVLGEFFSGVVTVQAHHRVIDSGAYRWVRHPSYSAALLLVLGIAMSFGNMAGVVVGFVAAALAYSYRARVEEEALLSSIGAPYATFLATRKRFIPYVW